MQSLCAVGFSRVCKFLAVFCLLAVVSCQPARPPAGSGGIEAVFELPADATRFELDPAQTTFDIKVYRAGALASLGHNHIVSAGQIDAQIGVAEPFERSAFELRIPVDELRIDDPDARARNGAEFSEPVDAGAIAGTRENLLGPDQLDVLNFPEIVVRSVTLQAAEKNTWLVGVVITLRGKQHRLSVPLEVIRNDARLTATTEFSVKQSELGLTPFAVMLGALQVADELDIAIRLSATGTE